MRSYGVIDSPQGNILYGQNSNQTFVKIKKLNYQMFLTFEIEGFMSKRNAFFIDQPISKNQ